MWWLLWCRSPVVIRATKDPAGPAVKEVGMRAQAERSPEAPVSARAAGRAARWARAVKVVPGRKSAVVDRWDRVVRPASVVKAGLAVKAGLVVRAVRAAPWGPLERLARGEPRAAAEVVVPAVGVAAARVVAETIVREGRSRRATAIARFR